MSSKSAPRKRDDKRNLLKGISHETSIHEQQMKRMDWLQRKIRWSLAQIAFLRYRRTVEIYILKSSNQRRLEMKKAQYSKRIREMILQSTEQQIRYDDLMKEKIEIEARLQIKEAQHCQCIREMVLESKEQQVRYDYLMKEKKDNEARLQSEIDALRQQLTEKKRSEAEHEEERDKRRALPEPQSLGGAEKSFSVQSEASLSNNGDGVRQPVTDQIILHQVEDREVWLEPPPPASATVSTKTGRARFIWSHNDDVMFLNALIEEWQNWEDMNNRPMETDVLTRVSERCGNKLPKSIRHRLNFLIAKYGKTNLRDAKKNLAEYKNLLRNIRDEILTRGPFQRF